MLNDKLLYLEYNLSIKLDNIDIPFRFYLKLYVSIFSFEIYLWKERQLFKRYFKIAVCLIF